MGYTDAEIGLQVSLNLRALLEAQGVSVVLTRGAEPLILGLPERSKIANDLEVDIVISIHGNALEDNTTKAGTEVFYWANNKTPVLRTQNAVCKELAEAVTVGIKG